jgi:hypothetical protein
MHACVGEFIKVFFFDRHYPFFSYSVPLTPFPPCSCLALAVACPRQLSFSQPSQVHLGCFLSPLAPFILRLFLTCREEARPEKQGRFRGEEGRGRA